MITTEDIKVLRDRTGISVMKCKQALEEAGGDIEKAIVLLKKRSGIDAEKKADRELKAGAVQAYVHSSKDVGALVELSSETDFVAKNEEFVALARDIAMHVAAANPQFLSRNDIDETSRETARSAFLAEVEGKPEDMKEKILEGKLSAYFAEHTLLDQPYIKNPDETIASLIESATQKFGEKIAVARFVRFSSRG